jgi:hypothetical protein
MGVEHALVEMNQELYRWIRFAIPMGIALARKTFGSLFCPFRSKQLYMRKRLLGIIGVRKSEYCFKHKHRFLTIATKIVRKKVELKLTSAPSDIPPNI